MLPEVNTVDPIGDAALLTRISGDQALVVSIMIGLFGMYAVLMIVTSIRDRHDAKSFLTNPGQWVVKHDGKPKTSRGFWFKLAEELREEHTVRGGIATDVL